MERDKVVQPFPTDDKVGQTPDPILCRDEWLRIVQPVERVGRLDHIPAKKPVSKKEQDMAKKQNYWLSRRTFAMPDGYNNIKWRSKEHV